MKSSKKRHILCVTCDKSFPSSCDLRLHVRTHTGERPFSCSVCNKRFSSLSSFCERHYHSGPSLLCHLGSHHVQHDDQGKLKSEILVCKELNQAAAVPMENAENGCSSSVSEEVAVCFICSKSLNRKSQATHYRKHTGDTDDVQHRCTTCNKSFSSLKVLKVHVMSHTGEKPYRCSVCDKGFCNSGYRDVHLRMHTDEKPYMCTICGRQFAVRSSMRRHLQTHSDVNECADHRDAD